MNFFGHACLAAAENGDARFVLGAMLPDLAPMAGVRIRSIDDTSLAAGHAHHVATDVAFHGAAEFTGWAAEASRALQAAGVRRGPARGVAHVGIELLLDGWLAHTRGVPSVYRDALEAGPLIGADAIRFRGVPTPWSTSGSESGASVARQHTRNATTRTPSELRGGLPELCRRIAESPLPAAYASPSFTTERILRVLGRRPRLAVRADERAAISAWTETTAGELSRRAPALLAAVEATAG